MSGDMSCFDTLQTFAFRAFTEGEQLPMRDITLCDQFVIIGSGMMVNVYFALAAVCLGFFFALLLAVMKASPNPILRVPAGAYVFLFRGSPLFIQFFFAYFLFVMIPKELTLNLAGLSWDFSWLRLLTKVWYGGLFVLFLNTAAYSAEIFYGALQAVPKGDVEAAKAYGFGPFKRFRRVTLPTLLRLAWPSYTNEAIFLFHATTLVFLAAFPARNQMGEALKYVGHFNEQTFNPFVPFPIIAFYFLICTGVIIFTFGLVNRRLNRHLDPSARVPIRYRPNLLR